MGTTGDCSSGRHHGCPGYYRIAHPCECPCHKPKRRPAWHNPDCECPCHDVIQPGLIPCPECQPTI